MRQPVRHGSTQNTTKEILFLINFNAVRFKGKRADQTFRLTMLLLHNVVGPVAVAKPRARTRRGPPKKSK